jgi:hypothetical protein
MKMSGLNLSECDQPVPPNKTRLPNPILSGFREACDHCENLGPHDGPHGWFAEGDFYEFEGELDDEQA